MTDPKPSSQPVFRNALPKIHTVCVLGGAGFVGRQVVQLLNAQGYTVRVPTRRRERAKGLLVLSGVDVIEMDILRPGALLQVLAGCDAVINLSGILHERVVGRVDKPGAARGDFYAVHIALPRTLVQSCGKLGIRRIMHMSALNADATSASAYLRSKGVGEAVVLETALPHSENERWYLDGPKFTRGLDLAVTVLRPSVIFGEQDNFLNQFARLLRFFPVMALGCADSKLQPIFVDDVARAFVANLENPASFGRAYDLCGPKTYSLHQLVAYVAQLQGRKPWVWGLGKRASFYLAWLLEYLPGKLMTRDDFFALQQGSVCAPDVPCDVAATPLEQIAVKYLRSGASR